MYGALYSVAATNALIWLLAARSVRARSRAALLMTGVGTVVTVGLAALLLGPQEYGEQIFPTVWGVLALLPTVGGVAALAQLLRAR